MNNLFHIINFGCQMNLRDSEIISTLLQKSGYNLTPSVDNADIIIVNTCAVRERAVVRALGRMKQISILKRENPDKIIAVGGCISQTDSDRLLREAPFIDLIFGTHKIGKIVELIDEVRSNNKECLISIEEDEFDYPCECGFRSSSVSAFITVMSGCNNYCSYCIVPYARGRERYRPLKDIICEAVTLVSGGYKDITLIGQNINAWRENNKGFDYLLKCIYEETRVLFLRFITSHPKNLSDAIIGQFSTNRSLAPSLHLPLQSGSDKILELMNRGYNIGYYKGLIDKLRSANKEITITTDILVGFPGETEDDFEKTLDAVREIGFDGAYTFRYSPRRYTSAEGLGGSVPEYVRLERLEKLIDVVQNVGLERNKRRIGKMYKSLIEGSARRGGLKGRLGSNQVIVLKGRANVGDIVDVIVEETSYWTLKGEILEYQEERN
ncbi:MAG: tRNA (N6-isopentenyl adenosine(37)-C2)-methylthiotransferase MiaB [bacterium]